MGERETFEFLFGYCPKEFDLGNHELGSLFCFAASGVINNARGITEKENPEYIAVIRAGKVLYQYAEQARERLRRDVTDINPPYDMFFSKFLHEIGENPQTFEDVAASVMQLGLDLIKVRELSKPRQKELGNLCLKLSERASSCWHEYHPHGFKSYAA